MNFFDEDNLSTKVCAFLLVCFLIPMFLIIMGMIELSEKISAVHKKLT